MIARLAGLVAMVVLLAGCARNISGVYESPGDAPRIWLVLRSNSVAMMRGGTAPIKAGTWKFENKQVVIVGLDDAGKEQRKTYSVESNGDLIEIGKENLRLIKSR